MSHPPPPSASLLRRRGGADAGRVGMVELFFDLVFVFAVTQLSHTLLQDLSGRGALQVGLLLLSASLPQAFADKGLSFAAAYVFMQVGRALFFLWAVRGERLALRRNFQRILAWLTLAAPFWIACALAPAEARLGWWTLALAIEVVSPALYVWVPGLGRSSAADWDVDGGHMAEHCAVGDELVLAHPAHAAPAGIAAIIGGPALYLAGVGAFKWVSNERPLPPLSHLVGLGLLALLCLPAFAHLLSALAIAAATSATLVLVAAREQFSLRSPRGAGHGHPV